MRFGAHSMAGRFQRCLDEVVEMVGAAKGV